MFLKLNHKIWVPENQKIEENKIEKQLNICKVHHYRWVLTCKQAYIQNFKSFYLGTMKEIILIYDPFGKVEKSCKSSRHIGMQVHLHHTVSFSTLQPWDHGSFSRVLFWENAAFPCWLGAPVRPWILGSWEPLRDPSVKIGLIYLTMTNLAPMYFRYMNCACKVICI